MPSARWQSYGNRLREATILAPEGYGKGFPIMLPWGLDVVDLLVNELLDRCRSEGLDVRTRSPTRLTDAAGYDREVEPFGGFEHVYRMRLGGREVVARPDAAVDNLRSLDPRRAAREGHVAVLAAYPCFRAVEGFTPPLFRDRAIWPVLQVNALAARRSAADVRARIVAALGALLGACGLPVQLVHIGPWKGYAEDLVYVTLPRAGQAPTVLAMLYQVGPAYRSAAGLPADVVAFDAGVSEKLIGALYLDADERDVTLPASLAPLQVVVAHDAPLPALDAPPSLRIACESLHRGGWWKPWRRRGVPVLVELAGGRRRVRVGALGWRRWEPGEGLAALLAEADASMRERRERDLALHPPLGFEVRCGRCRREAQLHGGVIGGEAGRCVRCGRPGRLSFAIDAAQLF